MHTAASQSLVLSSPLPRKGKCITGMNSMKHALPCDPLRDFSMEVSKRARGPHVQKREGLRGKASREEDDKRIANP